MSVLKFFKSIDPMFTNLNEVYDDIDLGGLPKASETDMHGEVKESESDDDQNVAGIFDDDYVPPKPDETGKDKKSADDATTEDDTVLEEEAKAAGITIDELKEQKAEESLEAEAKAAGITVDELKEQKAEEALEEEAKAAGITIEELKEQKEAEALTKDIFKIDADDDPGVGDTKEVFELKAEDLVEFEGIQLDEGEIVTKANLKDVWNKSIAAAKKSFNLDEVSGEARAVITHLEAGKENLMDFYSSPELRELDRFMMLPDVSALSEVKYEKLISGGMKSDDARELVETTISEMSEDDIKAEAAEYKKAIGSMRITEMNKISKKSEEYIAKQKQIAVNKAAAENEVLVSMVNQMDKYRGIELTNEAKANIVNAIKAGTFHKVIDSNAAKAKLVAFMDIQFGPRINKLSKSKETGATKSFTEGAKKVIGKTYNKQEKAKSTNQGGQRETSKQSKGVFDPWGSLGL